MSVDFKEERRWKLATAFQIAHAVADWHLASPEEKVRLTVCRLTWKTEKDMEDVDMEKGGDAVVPEARTEPDDEEEPVNEEESTIQPTEVQEPSADVVEAALGTGGIPAEEHVQEVLLELERPKEEEEDVVIKEEQSGVDLSAFRETGNGDDGEGDQDDADGDGEGDGDGEAFREEANLMGLINDEATRPGSSGMDVEIQQKKAQAQRLRAIRIPLLEKIDAATTTVDLANLSLNEGTETYGEDGGFLSHGVVQLPDLFPDLLTFGPFAPRNESRGKPDKRIDETTSLGRVTYVSRLMDAKPVLLSTLQPAKKHRRGGWEDVAEFYPGDDSNPELKPTEFFMPSPPRTSTLHALNGSILTHS